MSAGDVEREPELLAHVWAYACLRTIARPRAAAQQECAEQERRGADQCDKRQVTRRRRRARSVAERRRLRGGRVQSGSERVGGGRGRWRHAGGGVDPRAHVRDLRVRYAVGLRFLLRGDDRFDRISDLVLRWNERRKLRLSDDRRGQERGDKQDAAKKHLFSSSGGGRAYCGP